MKARNWIFSVRYWERQQGPISPIERWAVVGPARASTVEAALHLASVPEHERTEIRSHTIVREFVEGRLDPDKTGYYVHELRGDDAPFPRDSSWCVCIGPVHEVIR